MRGRAGRKIAPGASRPHMLIGSTYVITHNTGRGSIGGVHRNVGKAVGHDSNEGVSPESFWSPTREQEGHVIWEVSHCGSSWGRGLCHRGGPAPRPLFAELVKLGMGRRIRDIQEKSP